MSESDCCCTCPHCGSSVTASRRQLFYALLGEADVPQTFTWYDESQPHVFPPKSLFMMLLTVSLILSLPTLGFWLYGMGPAIEWLALVVLALVACLGIDVALTHRRYRSWGQEWLCGDCQAVFASCERAIP